MKKQWLVMATAAVFGLVANSFADVQNIRLSGDIRIRGYYLANVAGDAVEDQVKLEDSFITQRTRVCVEADLEDHVLVVVTLKAEGQWGADSETSSTAGAGSGGTASSDRINRLWDVGVSEAYVQLSELFYTPATLKLGRQYLHYGRGLIFSSVDQEYNFDAARLVLDYYPVTVDLLYAKAAENTPFGPGTGARDTDVLFINARYERTDSVLKDIEAYFGYLANNTSSGSKSRIPPSANSASPMLIGIRGDLNPTDNLSVWFEGAYEFGADGTTDNDTLSAFLVNAGARYAPKDVAWSPSLNFNYTFASGGSRIDPLSGDVVPNSNAFVPWFDYVDGYNGYLFAPRLSNIHIFNLGASVKPYENTTLSVQGYYYRSADTIPGNLGVGLAGNHNVDFGGLGFSPSGSSRDLGWEVDGILGYDYSKDVRFQLVYAAFIPDNGFTVYPSDAVAHLVRGEVNVRF